jgi:hypothetical protein
MMRHLAIALVLSILAGAVIGAQADISPYISYQGVLRDSEGNPVPDGTYMLLFSIYDQPTGGTPLWMETHEVEVEGGLMNVTLGIALPLVTLGFDVPYWLGITIDGGELVPRTEFTSVPYAAHSGYADLASRADTADFAWNTGVDADWIIVGDDMYTGVPGGVGIGDTLPDWRFDIYNPAAENTYMQITNSVTGDSKWTGMLIGVSGTGDGWVFNNGPGDLHVGGGAAVQCINIDGDGNAGVGVSSPQAKLDVAGTVKMIGFQMQTGAVPNYVLTSNLNGEGTWQPAGALLGGSAAGNVVLDARGEASVELPASLTAGGRELRYQLTCIGGFAPVYVAEKERGGVFRIAGGEPGMEVSWQVTTSE